MAKTKKKVWKAHSAEYNRGHKEGASQSIMKSLRELDAILAREGIEVDGKLRPVYYDKLEELLTRWYRKGFKRAHITLRDDYDVEDLPLKMVADMDVRFIKGRERVDVELRSSLAPKHAPKPKVPKLGIAALKKKHKP